MSDFKDKFNKKIEEIDLPQAPLRNVLKEMRTEKSKPVSFLSKFYKVALPIAAIVLIVPAVLLAFPSNKPNAIGYFGAGKNASRPMDGVTQVANPFTYEENVDITPYVEDVDLPSEKYSNPILRYYNGEVDCIILHYDNDMELQIFLDQDDVASYVDEFDIGLPGKYYGSEGFIEFIHSNKLYDLKYEDLESAKKLILSID